MYKFASFTVLVEDENEYVHMHMFFVERHCKLYDFIGCSRFLATEKEAMASDGLDGNVLRKKLNKVVLAYSGGLDTSVIVPWLRCVTCSLSLSLNHMYLEMQGLDRSTLYFALLN